MGFLIGFIGGVFLLFTIYENLDTGDDTMALSQHTQDAIQVAFDTKAQAALADGVVTSDNAVIADLDQQLALADQKLDSDTNTSIAQHQLATAKAHDALQALADELGFTLPS